MFYAKKQNFLLVLMDYADLYRKFSGRLNLIASVKLSKLPITIYTRSWQIKF